MLGIAGASFVCLGLRQLQTYRSSACCVVAIFSLLKRMDVDEVDDVTEDLLREEEENSDPDS